jgi:hypothetical protein
MLRQFFTTEFVWFVPNDDNRAEDGRALRYEFLNDLGVSHPGSEWMDLPCSMLEMLIAVSRRLAFEAEGAPRDWFWELVDNMGLAHINDQQYDDERCAEIEEALNRVIWRTYHSNGQGGLFPLVDPVEDQREVELWYQLSYYLISDL